MTQRTFGYARVSSKNQFEDRQLLSMENFHISAKHLYVDKQSGKDFDRPAYRKMVRALREGDLLVVSSIDRLGRNYQDILEQWRMLIREKRVDIVVLDMPLLDTRASKDLLGTLISDLVLQLLSFVAQNERENIRQRQAEGIAAAKKRGIKFGRPSKMYCPETAADLIGQWSRKEISAREAWKALGISSSTFYRWAEEAGM